jgi:hypothetical protein
VPNKKKTGTTPNIEVVRRHTSDHERRCGRFSKESRLVTNTLTDCYRVNRNKKHSNKANIFYFVNAWLLPKLAPKMRLPKLV